jgi:hypothetical protein
VLPHAQWDTSDTELITPVNYVKILVELVLTETLVPLVSLDCSYMLINVSLHVHQECTDKLLITPAETVTKPV